MFVAFILTLETLGKELGLYKQSSDRMGQLSMEALRACRLVVDTGMHAFAWSLDRAKEYMLEHTAMGEHDALTEVIRYVTWPGQATAYKVGERFIHRLRKKAEEELAADDLFDPRDFYEIVLNCGPVPLDVLEKLIDDYIASKLSTGGEDAERILPTKDIEASRANDVQFVDTMTFANWCKCCVVPGACQI